MIRTIARVAAGLFAAASAGHGMAATAPGTTIDGAAWRIESATAFRGHATVAAQRKEQILVWDGGKGAQVASQVLLLVEAPYDQVQPAVQQALAPLGALSMHSENSPLAYLPSGWSEVLMSRRADLREALVAHAILPRLQLAVVQGAITPAEMEQRLARERARVDLAPQSGDQLDAFRATYPYWYATQDRSHGLTGRRKSELLIRVSDVSATFGHPATEVYISREDSYPNPGYLLKQVTEFNPLGSSTPRVLSDNVVPAAAFTAVRDALASLPGKVEIARSPLAWVQPVAQPTTPVLNLAAPAGDAPAIQAQAIRWDALVIDPHSRGYTPIYPHALLALPDGDLMVSAGMFDDSGQSQRVWRLHDANGEWKAEEVWRGAAGTAQLSLSADGRIAWFNGGNAPYIAHDLYAYDIASRSLTRHAATWPDADRRNISNLRWELAGDQRPAIFDHDYSLGDDDGRKNLLGNNYLTVLRPTTAPSSANGTWPFSPTFSSPRQSMMGARMKGNTLIWPVRWRDPKTFWVEDQPGIAQLDAASGRVLRALTLPQRFGTPDPTDATGVAQWIPKPLGSPEAGWIATGFVLMMADDGHMPPTKGGNDRFVGMHVVNLEDGRVLSALLGRSDTLQAAARSAHGRFLALGSNGARRGDRRFALWDIAQGRTPVQLETSSNNEVHALAFSWNGADLWALCRGELLHWHLPDALIDAATGGSFPDQSSN